MEEEETLLIGQPVVAEEYFHLCGVLKCAAGIVNRIAQEADELVHDPLEVLHRAAGIFRMAGHMLGQRLLHRHGHVVSFADGGMQSVALPVTADPLGGNPVSLGNPPGKLVCGVVFILCHVSIAYIVNHVPSSRR